MKTKTNKNSSILIYLILHSRNTLISELKYIFIILALTGVLLQNFTKTIIYANFELNRDYIAKNLCVKKDVPENCCKGSCQLKKELDAEDKKEQSPFSNNQKDVKEFQLFCQHEFPFEFISFVTNSQFYASHKFAELSTQPSAIFHPPKA